MKRAVALSIFDQALISAFNLLLNLVLIAYASPAEFGGFVVIVAGAFFAISAQNALVVTPLNFLLPGSAAAERVERLSMLTSVNLVLSLAAAAAGFVAYLAIFGDLVLAAFAVPYLLVTLLREYVRAVMVVAGNIGRTLVFDMLAILCAAVLLPAFWQVLRPELAALATLLCGNLLALLLRGAALHIRPSGLLRHLKAYRGVWSETRWALQGALQNEVEMRGHVFIVEHWRGAAAIGSIHAGRVTLAPLTLIAPSWRRVTLPRLTEMLARGASEEAARIVWSGVLMFAAACLAAGAALAAGWPLLEAFVFKGRYEDIATIVFWWWVYTAVVGTITVVATLLQARRRFRELAGVGLCVAGAILVLLIALTFTDLPLSTAILVLIGVHALELAVYCVMLRGDLFPRAAMPVGAEGGR